jgi:MoaD family protein
VKVRVEFFGTLKEIGKNESWEIRESAPLIDLLKEMVKKYGFKFEKRIFNPKDNELNHYVIILLNGRPISLLDGLKTTLNRDDKLSFLIPVSGG